MVKIIKKAVKFCFVVALSGFLISKTDATWMSVILVSFLTGYFFHQKPLNAFFAGFAGFLVYVFLFLNNNLFLFFTEGFSIHTLTGEVNYKNFSSALLLSTISGLSVLSASIVKYSKPERFITNRLLKLVDFFFFFLVVIPGLFISALISRYRKTKKIDIGLGPEPLINNVYHKRALMMMGYTAETFVEGVYFITSEFDYRGDKAKIATMAFFQRYTNVALFIRAILRYKAIYIYFNGGPLRNNYFLRPLEPHLLKLANVKVVVMPYGGDVNDMRFAKNYQFKHALSTDYPQFYKQNKRTTAQIARWIQHANFVISGCDWVDYTYHWDRLMLAHFSIDVEKVSASSTVSKTVNRVYSAEEPLKIFHAPNHKTIKGSRFIQQAVAELKNEGFPIELMLVQGKPNSEILLEIAKADIVADQLVIGWYAMFALEGLAMSKPVICYLREDLLDLYLFAGILESRDDIPFLNANTVTVKQLLKDVLEGKIDLGKVADKGLPYVKKYHSIQAVGKIFNEINRAIGILPQ